MANEKSYIFSFNKVLTYGILEKGLESDFERVLAFLKKLEMFKNE